MKKILIAAFIATHLMTAASAADLTEVARAERTRTGAFAGARLRISLNETRSRPVRAGLTISPTVHGVRPDGSVRLRIGEGLEYDVTGPGSPELSLAGRPMGALLNDQEGSIGAATTFRPKSLGSQLLSGSRASAI